MRKTLIGLGSLAIALAATPATAQDDNSGITITGSAAVVSDYRIRGVSQTGEEAAIQGSIGISHESGLYAGVWGPGVDFGEPDRSEERRVWNECASTCRSRRRTYNEKKKKTQRKRN